MSVDSSVRADGTAFDIRSDRKGRRAGSGRAGSGSVRVSKVAIPHRRLLKRATTTPISPAQ
jgi:hypothetical protein